MYMKHVKRALILASMLAGMGAALPAAAQFGFGGEYASDNWSKYYEQTARPMVAKMTATDTKKVMEMEMGLAKMEVAHRTTMTKMDLDHKMTILKMRQELESFIFSKADTAR
jgi:pyruvoyl-dependent arginine decarboxylase (PvlArgDC)